MNRIDTELVAKEPPASEAVTETAVEEGPETKTSSISPVLP